MSPTELLTDPISEPSRPQCSKRPRRPLRSAIEILNWLIESQDYRRYLQIGLEDTRLFDAVECHLKVGVGFARPEDDVPRCSYRMTSDAFFASASEKYDLVFIDGEHDASSVLRDIRNSLVALRAGGMIVVHDLHPVSEAQQRVPRDAEEWTGDGWKAWLQIRREQPELSMVVANTDYGVGIIYPGGDFRPPPLEGHHERPDWEDFRRHWVNWLNLMPVARLPEVLFGEKLRDGLTVVTLWRSCWNPVHQVLLDWKRDGNLPAGTHFVWVTPEGSETELKLMDEWRGFEALGLNYTCELIGTDDAKPRTFVQKHHVVAALYNEALLNISTEWVIFIEDDVIPERGGALRLLETIQQQPECVALVAAAYPRRENTAELCATDEWWNWYPWPDLDNTALTEVLWTGGGFAIYRGSVLRCSGPFHAESRGSQLWGGWDVNLCKIARAMGYRVLLDMGNRAEHRFNEA